MLKFKNMYSERGYASEGPRAQVAQRFVELMKSVHADQVSGELTRRQASELAQVLIVTAELVPEASETVLQKMVIENPYDRFCSCSTAFPGGVDFDVLAKHWNDPRLVDARDIAETHYGMTEIEADFIRSGLISASAVFFDPNYLDIYN